MNSSGKVKCTCGWSWNKSDSSKKDMYICHECGRDNSNNMKNGGWLDSYADGGTMQEHQENYNDYKVSAPEGMLGDGYSNVGRNYSPAWGGQFEDGGLIPMAQNGRATAADSLDIYNRSLKIDAYYNNLRKKGWYNKPKITDASWLTSKELKEELKRINKETVDTYNDQSKQGRKESYLTKMYPNKNIKETNLKALAEHKKLTRGTRYAMKDLYPSAIDPVAPTTVVDTRIIPKEFIDYTMRGNSNDISVIPPGGSITGLYRYDPLSVKPWNMLTDAEKKLRIKKYGTDGVPKSYIKGIKDKLNKDPKTRPNKKLNKDSKPSANKKLNTDPKPKVEVIQPDLQRVEAISLPPMQQLASITPPTTSDVVRKPKSYNVNMKTYNMKGGPIDYYTRDAEGVDYEQAMRMKSMSDAFNRDILKRYGPQNEYRTPKSAKDAAERLKQLRSEFEITPNYQMGGSIYPVNYVPQAQDGDIIPSDLPDPINGVTYDPEGERTYYDDRLDRIVLTPSSNFSPRQSVINHEKFHKYQFDNLGSNYEITHQGAIPLFKKPSMVSTDEEYYKFHNRKGREAQQDIENVKSNYPEFKFVPNEVLFDKLIDREQYSNPYTLEGEAQAYENSLKDFAMGGSIPGSVGFSYARTNDPAPSNGPYAKKTMASAQNGAKTKNYFPEYKKIVSKSEYQKIKESLKERPRAVVKESIQAPKLPSRKNIKESTLTKQGNITKDNKGRVVVSNEKGVYVPYSPPEMAEITQHIPQSTLSKTWEVLSNPLTAVGYGVRNQRLPDNFSLGDRSNLDMATDVINPAFYINEGSQFLKNTGSSLMNVAQGNFSDAAVDFLGAGLNTLSVFPLAKGAKPLLNKAGKVLGTESGLLSNAGIDGATTLKDIGKAFKNRNKKLLTIGAENLDKELIKKINQLESPEGFKRLIQQETEMLKRDFPYLIDVEQQAVKNARTRISELYQTNLQGNFNANYLQARKLNPKLNPYTFGIPRNNAFFRQGLGSKNIPDGAINLSKEPSLRDDIFSKTFYGAESPGEIAIGREYAESLPVYDHEINHALQNGRNTVLDDELKRFFNNSENLVNDLTTEVNKQYNYFRKGKGGVPAREPSSFLAEARRVMLERGLIKDIYEPIGPKKVFEAAKNFKKNPPINSYNDTSQARIFNFAKTDSPRVLNFLSNSFNKLPVVVPVGLGLGAASQMGEEEPVPGMKQGGVIKDDMGQWNHPGEITEIGSNQITMEGVPYDVLGISDTGDVQMMYPEEEYEFDGTKVTEYPLAKNGAKTTTTKTTYPWGPGKNNKGRGDQLANFKNKPQKQKPKTNFFASAKDQAFLNSLKTKADARRSNINLRETPPLAVNDNIPNAHKMGVKADAEFAKQQQYEKTIKVKEVRAQAEAQKKFNALPKQEQQRVLDEQRNQYYGTVTQYEPEGFLETLGNIALAPFAALESKIRTGRVPDNLVKGIINDPKNTLNPMDAAYLATLGYAAAPYVGQAASYVAPYMAADAVVGGTTLTGVNLNNLINAGFAAHGLTNVGPDVVKWAENPSWEKAGHVAMDVAEILPVAGSASKMIGEGAGYVKNKANQALAKTNEFLTPRIDKAKTLIDDMGAVIAGERKTIGPKIDAINTAESNFYRGAEYTKYTDESLELNRKKRALEAKLSQIKNKATFSEINELSDKITNLQKRIDVAEQFKVNPEGLVQSGKNTSLGLETGSTDIMDLATGEKFPISTSVPSEKIIHTLEGDKVVRTLDNSTLPQVTPEYNITVKKNINFIENQIPGAKVFGSAKNVAEAEVPHILGDYDVIMSQTQYDKFAKANPSVGNNGSAVLHNIPGAAKGVDPIDINVIQEKAGKAIGTRAQELFKQVAPDEYYAAAKKAIKSKSEIKIPYSSQQLVDMTNPTTKSVVDAYESSKTKHINKIDALINYGKPSVVLEGQEQFVKSLVGSKGSIGHQFPLEQLSNVETNIEILDKIGFIGNKSLVAADAERMQLAINDYYINNSILARQVDKGKINKIEAAIKEYYPGAKGGAVHGIGQNHVSLGHPFHGDDNIISMKQLGMNLDKSDPMSYINSIEHQTSGQKLFTQEERTILSDILADIKKMDPKFKDAANQSENTSQLIEKLPYSEEGKKALYEFGKRTNRTMVKKSSGFGNSNFTATLRDFDDAIDAMEYQLIDINYKPVKSFNQRKDAAALAELKSQPTLSPDLELLPKQFKAIKGYVEGGIDKAKQRLSELTKERKKIYDDITDLSEKGYNKKYKEEIEKLKEAKANIDNEILKMNQMRNDLFDRRVHLNKLAEKMQTIGILGGGVATLVGLGTFAYKHDKKTRKEFEEFDRKLKKMTKEERQQFDKDLQERIRKADSLEQVNEPSSEFMDWFMGRKQNGGNVTKLKNGNELVKLNQLTNFTNYNTKQPGGWLDKY